MKLTSRRIKIQGNNEIFIVPPHINRVEIKKRMYGWQVRYKTPSKMFSDSHYNGPHGSLEAATEHLRRIYKGQRTTLGKIKVGQTKYHNKLKVHVPVGISTTYKDKKFRLQAHVPTFVDQEKRKTKSMVKSYFVANTKEAKRAIKDAVEWRNKNAAKFLSQCRRYGFNFPVSTAKPIVIGKHRR